MSLIPIVSGGGDSRCESIAEIACSGDFSSLCNAIKKAGLYHTLDDKHTHFTAFAPTNDAFDELLNLLHFADVRDLSKSTLEDLLLSHVAVDHVLYKDDLKHSCGHLLTMASGDQTRTICKNEKQEIFQKGAKNPDRNKPEIILFNVKACNGIVHVVDEVILPIDLYIPEHKPSCSTIAEIACGSNDFDVLCEAMKHTELTEALTDGSWTVFAPTDNAFHELLNAQHLHSIKDISKETLKEVLLYHTITNEELKFHDLQCEGIFKMTSDETTKTFCNTVQNHKFQRGTCNRRYKSNMPRIIIEDIKACNGYIHVVEDVLLPGLFCDEHPIPLPFIPTNEITEYPTTDFKNCLDENSLPSIAKVACTNPDFSILCDTVTTAGFADILNLTGTYTVFAPTNDAFERLGTSKLNELTADPSGELSRILLNHVTSTVYFDDDLVCGLELQTLVGSSDFFEGDFSTTICNNAGKFQVGNGNLFGAWPLITDADIETCNGVVHVVDNVILPKPML